MGPLEKAYHYLFHEISDPRVADWPLMAGPFPLASILIIYLLFVLFIGPLYMKNRPPFSLNRVMIFYNIFVAFTSGLVFYGIITSGYTSKLSLGCEPLIVSYDPEPMSLVRWTWWLMLLKIFELGDTIIFVLRKKYNQCSFLHIYHHVTTACLAWIAAKYAPGGMWTFNMIPNCFVHVIMYTYYLLASFGSETQKKIAPWKPYLTGLQLVQFVIMLVHTTQALLPSCEPARRPLAYLYMSQVIVIFYMFGEFYKTNYLKKKKV